MTPPLFGIRVLDLSQALSGPYCSMMLADAGADVIKIEPPDGGDHVRSWLPDGATQSPYILAANRSKRSVVVDMKRPGGAELLLDLARRSDVFLENFRPGVAARLGVGYEQVRAARPDVIYCSVSGFGQTGPLSHKLAYDLIASGYGGTMSVTGEEGGRPARPGVPQSDLIAAMAAAYSITLALMTRARTGQGAYLDIALFDGQLFAMAHHLLAYELTGRVPGAQGSAHPQVAPYQTYRTATIGINIAVLTEKQWSAFCALLDRQEWLADARYTTPGSRNAHRQELEQGIEAVLTRRPGAEWLRLLEEAGIPCGPINSTAELVADEHLEHRGMYLDYDVPGAARVRIPSAPWRGPGVMERWTPPPALGEHTDQVLTELLGASPERLAALHEQGVIGERSAHVVTGGLST